MLQGMRSHQPLAEGQGEDQQGFLEAVQAHCDGLYTDEG
jgi:hypothetical protein